jgi:hypothetical protein
MLSDCASLALIDEMIESYKVDFIIIGPKEYGVATAALQAVAGMRHRFRAIFDYADYLVLAVDTPPRGEPTSTRSGNKEIGEIRE